MNESSSDRVRSAGDALAEAYTVTRQRYKVSVEQRRFSGRNQYIIGIDPVPIMLWHDVPNARAELRAVVASTAGLVDRRQAILARVMAALSDWSGKGILFPSNYNDGDEYIPVLSTEPPPELPSEQV